MKNFEVSQVLNFLGYEVLAPLCYASVTATQMPSDKVMR